MIIRCLSIFFGGIVFMVIGIAFIQLDLSVLDFRYWDSGVRGFIFIWLILAVVATCATYFLKIE